MRVRVRRRLSALAALALAALAGIALFWTAQRVQTADSNLQQLKASNAQEKESLRVLHAEWDYLNRPDRIEALARTQLNMMPPGAGSVAGHESKTNSVIPAQAGIRQAGQQSASRSLPDPRLRGDDDGKLKPVRPEPTADDQKNFNTLLQNLNGGK